MQVVTPRQMSRIEERSEKLGVPRKQLMATAGKLIADRIVSYTAHDMKTAPENTSVVFLAGSGNNGKAKLIKRGKKTIDCDDPKWQKRAAHWCALWRIRPILIVPFRIVDKIDRLLRKTWRNGN